MDTLAEIDGRLYEAMTIARADDFVPPFKGVPFPCLIWDHDGRFSNAERFLVAGALLDAGCRYAVCGGQHCSTWHDVVDEEWVARHVDESDEVQEAAHVMTTWHTGESPDEVAFFFVLNTNFDDHEFTRYLVLHVGAGPTTEELDAAVRKYALNESALERSDDAS